MKPLVENTTIKVGIEHSISSARVLEARFDLHQNILSVKQNIEKRYGTEPSFMKLVLKNKQGQEVARMDDDFRTLGFYGAESDHTIFVIDLNPNSIHKMIEDLSTVQKFKISEADYDKLPDNFRKWKQELMIKRPDLFKKKYQQEADPATFDPEYLKEYADVLKVGDRVRLENGARGEIKYVGKIMDLGNGYHVGVLLDEPYGNSNGKVKGVKYFEAGDKYAIFIRPDKLQVGDFPVLDIDDEI